MLTSTLSKLMRSLLVVLLLLATSANGQTTFQKSFGGTSEEYIYAVEQLSDGGYIMCGRTISNTMNSSWDAYLVRLNASGDTVWTKNYGNVGYDEFESIKPTADGGFIMAGQTDNVDIIGDVYLVKTDANGVVTWSKTYGAAGTADFGYSVRQTTDLGYIIAGYTTSVGSGGRDLVLIKTDATGGVTWSKTYGGASDEEGRCVEQTADGGYIVSGYASSYGNGIQSYLIKTTSTGTVTWSKTFGGSNTEVGSSVKQLSDGSYILGGYTDSYGAGNFDFLLIKLTTAGAITWSKTYGGTLEDRGTSVQITADGGYIMGGKTLNYGGGNSDYCLVKTDATGGLTWAKAYGGSALDQAYAVIQTTDGGYALAGYANSYGQGSKDGCLIKTNSTGVSNCNEATASLTTNTPTVTTSTGATEGTGLAAGSPTTARRKSATVPGSQCFSAGVSCPVNASFTSSATTVCAGATVTFTNTTTGGAIGQSWEENGVLFSTSTSTQRTFATAGSYIIRLISTNGTCQDTATATITVNASVTPSVSITGGPQQPLIFPTTCGFTSVPVNGGTNPTYQWFVNGVAIGNSNNSTFIWGPSGTQQIVVQMTSNAPCANPVIVTDTIIASPINVTVTASGPTTFCSGGSVTLTANQGTSWEWNYNNTDTLQTYVVTPPVNFTGPMTIYLTIMDSISGCSSSNSTIVTVNPTVTPSVSITANPTGPICAGQQVTFTATPVGEGTPTYTWKINSISQPNSNSATFTSSTLTNGDLVTVDMVSSLSCANPTSATSNTITMAVNPTLVPSVNATANPTSPLCQDGCVTYVATPVNGGFAPAYQWNVNGSALLNQTSAVYTGCSLTSGDAVTVTLTSNATCVNPATATSISIPYTVTPVPAAPVISVNGNLLSSSYGTGNTWFMVGDPNPLGNGQVYSITQDGNYYIVYSYGNGCTIISDTINAIKIGIAENVKSTQLSVYPNPSNGSIYIETTMLSAGKIQLEIRNMLGQIVYTLNDKTQGGLYKKNIDLALTPGMYFLIMQTNEGRVTKKIEIVK